MTIDMQAVNAAINATTPGPWETRTEVDGWRAGRDTVVWANGKRVLTVDQTRLHHDHEAEANAAFAAAARTLVPSLLAEVERLRAVEQERDRFVAAADKLHGEWLDLKAELAKRDQEVLDLIGERDHNEEMADRLAEVIADITGRDIGEHSSENDPWRNALDFGENFMHRQKNAGVKPGEVTR